MIKTKRRYKKKFIKEKDNNNKRLIQTQIKLIDEYIYKEEKKDNAEKIKTELSKLEKAGGVNSNAFWTFKQQIEPKRNEELSNVK